MLFKPLYLSLYIPFEVAETSGIHAVFELVLSALK